jgi:hypothetical protein
MGASSERTAALVLSNLMLLLSQAGRGLFVSTLANLCTLEAVGSAISGTQANAYDVTV